MESRPNSGDRATIDLTHLLHEECVTEFESLDMAVPMLLLTSATLASRHIQHPTSHTRSTCPDGRVHLACRRRLFGRNP